MVRWERSVSGAGDVVMGTFCRWEGDDGEGRIVVVVLGTRRSWKMKTRVAEVKNARKRPFRLRLGNGEGVVRSSRWKGR